MSINKFDQSFVFVPDVNVELHKPDLELYCYMKM